ncbi:unnamed protein product, partial [Ixodes pacificus]
RRPVLTRNLFRGRGLGCRHAVSAWRFRRGLVQARALDYISLSPDSLATAQRK